MPLFPWKSQFNLQIPEIDAQHQNLVQTINALHYSMTHGETPNSLNQIINDLLEYTQNHFQTEENYFAQFNYPEAKQHRQEHLEFTRRVMEFKTNFDIGENRGLSLEILSFLCLWLKNHILGVDRKYAPFLISKGLK